MMTKMRELIFCKQVKAKVRKEDRCPNWDCAACLYVNKDDKPDFAELYLSNPDKLPLPLSIPLDRIVEEEFEYYLPNTLQGLKKKYSDDVIKQICGALVKFSIAIERCNGGWKVFKRKIRAIKKEINYLKKAQKVSIFPNEMYYEKIKELEECLRVSSTPSVLAPLKAQYSGSPPVKRNIGKHESLIKPLRKVVYKLICGQEQGKEKAKKITAMVINDFFGEIERKISTTTNKTHYINPSPETISELKTTPKDVDNALHS